MSFDLLKPDIQITPKRKTHVIFDLPTVGAWKPVFGYSRNASQMSSANGDANARYIPGTGWEIAPIQLPGTTTDSADAQDALMPGNPLLQAISELKKITLFRTPSEYSGATDGATNLASTGNYWMQLQIPTGGSFDVALPSDPLPGIPAPDARSALHTWKMNRVAATTALHDPNASFLFEFVYVGAHLGASLFACIYFSGPPHVTPTWVGTGQYCIEFYGSGNAWIYQYGLNKKKNAKEWGQGVAWRWCAGSHPGDGKHSIEVRPYTITDVTGKSSGGTVSLLTGQSILAAPYSLPAQGGVFASQSHAEGGVFSVTATAPEGVMAAVQPGHLTLELNTINAMLHRITMQKYRDSTVIIDSPFLMLVAPETTDILKITLQADIPAGCSCTVDLIDATGAVCTAISGGDGVLSFWFHPAANNVRTYMVKATLISDSAHTHTPRWKGSTVTMDGALTTMTPGSFDVTVGSNTGAHLPTKAVGQYSITYGEDPSYETASFLLSDLSDSLLKLKSRSDIPVQIRTECIDPRDGTTATSSVLFSGLVTRAPRQKFGRNDANTPYPASNWGQFSCEAVGDWKLLKDSLSPLRYNFGVAPGPDGQPIKPFIVDVIKTALNWMDVDASRIDIPTTKQETMQLGSPEGGYGQDLLVELGTDLAEYVKNLIYNYLGYRFYRDMNAAPGADPTDFGGMWRIKKAAVPPYHYLASFVPEGNGQSSGSYSGITPGVTTGIVGHLPHTTGAFPPVTVAGQAGVQETFYQDPREYTLAPEGNWLFVSGNGNANDAEGLITSSGGSGDYWYGPPMETLAKHGLIVQNQQSFNFLNVAPSDPKYPDPTHPDYLGRVKPIYFFEPALKTPRMIRAVARRLVQTVFHAQKIMTYEAPLILIWDTTDTLQCRPRPLRHGDPVAVTVIESDGSRVQKTGLIWSVHPTWEEDWIQMAVYEVWIPNQEFQGQLA